MTAREHVLALDLGTTGVRALVVRADGAVRARAWRPLAARFPAPGWVEQDAEDWWTQSVAVMREALAQAGLAARDLAALGIVSQRSTAVAFDARSGAALAPAIGWQDQRTAPRVAELAASGIAANTLASATKFEWLLGLAAVAEAARAGRLRLGTSDVWLTRRLSGECCATDPGHSSCTGLWDASTGTGSGRALDRFGLDAAWLARVVPTAVVVGETRALGTPVALASRAGDQQAASFAQGVHLPGAGKLTLGTSAMLEVHTGPAPARAPRTWCGRRSRVWRSAAPTCARRCRCRRARCASMAGSRAAAC
jgi:glycerol kinase